MLLSIPPKDSMMKKCMQLTEDTDKDDGKNLVHPSRLINCLVSFDQIDRKKKFLFVFT